MSTDWNAYVNRGYIKANDITLVYDPDSGTAANITNPHRFLSPNSGSTGAVIIIDAAGDPDAAFLQFTNNAGSAQYGVIRGLAAGGLALYAGGSEVCRVISGKQLIGTTTAFDATSPASLNVQGGFALKVATSSPATLASFYTAYAAGRVGWIGTDGTSSVSYNTTSDYRLKQDVRAIDGAINRLMALKPSRFAFRATPDVRVDGFIAHEVQEVVPEAVDGEKDGVNEAGEPVYQGIDQAKLVPLLTAALQEAITRLAALEAKLAA